jgi:polysaccharide export outer membrane protein
MRRLLCLALLLVASACSTVESASAGGRGNIKNYDATWFGVPDRPGTGPAPTAYRIGPGDKLAIIVLQLPDIPKDQTVNAHGDISMPLIGSVHVQGLTTRELQAQLKSKFGEKYLQSPEVQVAVTEALSDRVTIDGAVKSPGVYPLAGTNTLVGAVSLASGLSETAIPSRVAIFRVIKGQRVGAAFDLTKIRKGLEPDPKIYGNDLIVIEGSKFSETFDRILNGITAGAVFGR